MDARHAGRGPAGAAHPGDLGAPRGRLRALRLVGGEARERRLLPRLAEPLGRRAARRRAAAERARARDQRWLRQRGQRRVVLDQWGTQQQSPSRIRIGERRQRKHR